MVMMKASPLTDLENRMQSRPELAGSRAALTLPGRLFAFRERRALYSAMDQISNI